MSVSKTAANHRSQPPERGAFLRPFVIRRQDARDGAMLMKFLMMLRACGRYEGEEGSTPSGLIFFIRSLVDTTFNSI